jgi:hypothetical protein
MKPAGDILARSSDSISRPSNMNATEFIKTKQNKSGLAT